MCVARVQLPITILEIMISILKNIFHITRGFVIVIGLSFSAYLNKDFDADCMMPQKEKGHIPKGTVPPEPPKRVLHTPSAKALDTETREKQEKFLLKLVQQDKTINKDTYPSRRIAQDEVLDSIAWRKDGIARIHEIDTAQQITIDGIEETSKAAKEKILANKGSEAETTRTLAVMESKLQAFADFQEYSEQQPYVRTDIPEVVRYDTLTQQKIQETYPRGPGQLSQRDVASFLPDVSIDPEVVNATTQEASSTLSTTSTFPTLEVTSAPSTAPKNKELSTEQLLAFDANPTKLRADVNNNNASKSPAKTPIKENFSPETPTKPVPVEGEDEEELQNSRKHRSNSASRIKQVRQNYYKKSVEEHVSSELPSAVVVSPIDVEQKPSKLSPAEIKTRLATLHKKAKAITQSLAREDTSVRQKTSDIGTSPGDLVINQNTNFEIEKREQEKLLQADINKNNRILEQLRSGVAELDALQKDAKNKIKPQLAEVDQIYKSLVSRYEILQQDFMRAWQKFTTSRVTVGMLAGLGTVIGGVFLLTKLGYTQKVAGLALTLSKNIFKFGYTLFFGSQTTAPSVVTTIPVKLTKENFAHVKTGLVSATSAAAALKLVAKLRK